MQAFETSGRVTPEHTVTLALPADLPPGEYDFIVYVRPRVTARQTAAPVDWPLHNYQVADPNNTFRREDLHGDDGR